MKAYHDDGELEYGSRAVSTAKKAFPARQLHSFMPAVEDPWEASAPEIAPEVVPETAVVLSIALFSLGTAVTLLSVAKRLL